MVDFPANRWSWLPECNILLVSTSSILSSHLHSLYVLFTVYSVFFPSQYIPFIVPLKSFLISYSYMHILYSPWYSPPYPHFIKPFSICGPSGNSGRPSCCSWHRWSQTKSRWNVGATSSVHVVRVSWDEFGVQDGAPVMWMLVDKLH